MTVRAIPFVCPSSEDALWIQVQLMSYNGRLVTFVVGHILFVGCLNDPPLSVLSSQEIERIVVRIVTTKANT